MTSVLSGKNINEIVFVCILVLLLLYNYEFALPCLHFPGISAKTIMVITAYYLKFSSCNFNFNVFCFILLTKTYTHLFVNSTNKNLFQDTKSVRRKYYQLIAFKILLKYLFITLLINKVFDSNKQQFLFNTFLIHFSKVWVIF